MFSNYSNNGIDSFPFSTGSFRPASMYEEDAVICSEMRRSVLSVSGTDFLSWVRQMLQH